MRVSLPARSMDKVAVEPAWITAFVTRSLTSSWAIITTVSGQSSSARPVRLRASAALAGSAGNGNGEPSERPSSEAFGDVTVRRRWAAPKYRTPLAGDAGPDGLG